MLIMTLQKTFWNLYVDRGLLRCRYFAENCCFTGYGFSVEFVACVQCALKSCEPSVQWRSRIQNLTRHTCQLQSNFKLQVKSLLIFKTYLVTNRRFILLDGKRNGDVFSDLLSDKQRYIENKINGRLNAWLSVLEQRSRNIQRSDI